MYSIIYASLHGPPLVFTELAVAAQVAITMRVKIC